MTTRLFISILLVLVFGALTLGAEDLIITSPTKVGSLTVAPGNYGVKVQGSLVFLVDQKTAKTVSTVGTIEKTDKKASATTMELLNENGTQKATAILLRGADFKVVFSR